MGGHYRIGRASEPALLAVRDCVRGGWLAFPLPRCSAARDQFKVGPPIRFIRFKTDVRNSRPGNCFSLCAFVYFAASLSLRWRRRLKRTERRKPTCPFCRQTRCLQCRLGFLGRLDTVQMCRPQKTPGPAPRLLRHRLSHHEPIYGWSASALPPLLNHTLPPSSAALRRACMTFASMAHHTIDPTAIL
jgi:hypothetical protein